MDPRKDRLLELLLLHGLVVKDESTFALADGTMSHWYVDCTALAAAPAAKAAVAALLYDLAKQVGARVLKAGGPAAQVFANAAAEHSVNRSQPLQALAPESDGEVVGPCLIVQDVMATGMSTLAVVDQARAHGLEVRGVLAVVDREEGAAVRLEAHGIPVYALVTGAELQARRNAVARHAHESAPKA
jgi:orotate phosphoribosyltransferase